MEFLKKIGKSLLIGSLAGAAIAIITHSFVPDLIDRLEHQSYYMRYFWKYMELDEQKDGGSKTEQSSIYIVDIDDRTQHKLGMYWNWNRSCHAEMINSLSRRFPAAIVFDINFYDPENSNHAARIARLLQRSRALNPGLDLSDKILTSIIKTIDYDEQLIESTRRSGVVYHGLRMSDERDYPGHALSQVAHRKSESWHDSLNPASALIFSPGTRKHISSEKAYIDGIFPALARAANGIGHLNIPPNTDGVIREIPLVYGFGEKDPVYLPISMRTILSLFATPPEEVRYVHGKYLDLGKPFKIFKDEKSALSCSYPNVSIAQIKAILASAEKIMALKEGEVLAVTAFCAIGRDEEGARYVSMHCGNFTEQMLPLLAATDMSGIISMPVGSEQILGPETSILRDSEIDWILMAPHGDREWYLAQNELQTLAMLDTAAFAVLAPGERKLLFHSFTATRKNGVLLSSIPVLRDKTLIDLCRASWDRIASLGAGFRMDFGRNVRIPLRPNGRHIVTYFGPKGAPFRYYSYYDIMKDRIRGSLEGKIFIVGSTVPNMFDIVSVPLCNVYPGVEVHASLMNSFLTNHFVRRLAGWRDFLILILVGVMVGFIAYMLKPLPGALLTLALVFVYFLVAMMAFGSLNLWIEVARPILTIILTYSAVMAYRYITEEKDRKFLQNTFKAYLSPELIDMMYQSKRRPKLGGDEGVRTAYFTDIQGFSIFSEKLGSPTRLVELLNEYLTAMTDILLEHYGTLDKYEGDAIIAFFGAPMPTDDHARQACATALSMQRRLGELRRKWRSEEEKWPSIVHEMRMRIGINTGAITTGNMGSAVRMNYTMMGDAVNLAARLESAAKQYGVYTMISSATHDLVKEQFEARQIDKITVVGKSEPVIVYELLAHKGELPEELQKMITLYQSGLDYFYNRQWDKAIERLSESWKLEPFRDIAPQGITPSKKIISYCEHFMANPPDAEWNGVMQLTSK
jgi:class 3 adenylate cyclase/CHASE2 domain-containing sensor protein